MEGRQGKAVLAIVGGALALAGSLLAWAKVSIDLSLGGESFSQSLNVKGTSTDDGKIALVLAIVVLVAGIAAVAMKGKGLKVLGIATAVVSALVGALGAYDWIDIKNKAGDIKSGALAASGGDPLVQKMIQDAIKVGPAIGLYLVVLGGILGVIGGIIISRSKSEPPMEASTFDGIQAPPPTPPA